VLDSLSLHEAKGDWPSATHSEGHFLIHASGKQPNKPVQPYLFILYLPIYFLNLLLN
jgi:hypothetical protein